MNLIPDSSIVSFFIGKNNSLERTLKNKDFEKFSLVKMEQTHSDNFAEASENNFDIGIKEVTIPDVDAIITTKKNILLSVKSADCLPILIHWTKNDESNDLITAIHSGRAGTEKKILTKVLLHLKTKYGVGKIENGVTNGELTIWLGPAICKKCYQIDKKTNTHYDLYQKNIDQVWQVFPKNKVVSETDPSENITTSTSDNIKIIRNKYCTLHNNDLFYSYRKSGKGVRMNYSLIGLN